MYLLRWWRLLLWWWWLLLLLLLQLQLVLLLLLLLQLLLLLDQPLLRDERRLPVSCLCTQAVCRLESPETATGPGGRRRVELELGGEQHVFCRAGHDDDGGGAPGGSDDADTVWIMDMPVCGRWVRYSKYMSLLLGV